MKTVVLGLLFAKICEYIPLPLVGPRVLFLAIAAAILLVSFFVTFAFGEKDKAEDAVGFYILTVITVTLCYNYASGVFA